MLTSQSFRPVFWLLLSLPCTVVLSAAKWDALKAEELAATQAGGDHAVDAEVLFSNVDISFSDNTTTKKCYRRLKVYSARGVELVQKFGIDYTNYSSISRLAARLTKPGGASTEFSKKDFLETGATKTDTEGFVDYTLRLENSMLGVFAYETDEGHIKFSLRSKGNVDVQTFSKRYGGGGHKNASGITLNEPFDSGLRKMIPEIAKYFNQNYARS